MKSPALKNFSTSCSVLHVFLVFNCLLILNIGESAAQDYEQHEYIQGATLYDYDPSTELGNDIFGTIIADFSQPVNGELRCSHGGPVCMEFTNGTLIAFYANTSSHNLEGWSEYAISKDHGRSWDKYHPFPYSYAAYKKDPEHPVWIEEGLVTKNGVAVLILTHFGNGTRIENSITRSMDHGETWSAPVPMAETPVGYPAAVAVTGKSNYILVDGLDGYHALYVSMDDGKSWRKRSTLPLQKDAWYGALCLMEDRRLLAGAYVTADENHFYYCISEDEGRTWGVQQQAYLDKKVRDPELACLDGNYYLHGRSGQSGEGRGRFVLYQSSDGMHWNKGVIISSDTGHPDGYSHNCIINQYNKDLPQELMVLYSICYTPPRTSEYVFFIKP